MSAAIAKARPAARPELRRDEVHELRLVQGTRPRRSVAAILMLFVAVAVASVVVSMVLNTRMAQTSFEIREQQLVLNELEAQSWTMRAELDRKASPTRRLRRQTEWCPRVSRASLPSKLVPSRLGLPRSNPEGEYLWIPSLPVRDGS